MHSNQCAKQISFFVAYYFNVTCKVDLHVSSIKLHIDCLSLSDLKMKTEFIRFQQSCQISVMKATGMDATAHEEIMEDLGNIYYNS